MQVLSFFCMDSVYVILRRDEGADGQTLLYTAWGGKMPASRQNLARNASGTVQPSGSTSSTT